MLDGAVPLDAAAASRQTPYALVFGSEGAGLPPEFQTFGQAVKAEKEALRLFEFLPEVVNAGHQGGYVCRMVVIIRHRAQFRHPPPGGEHLKDRVKGGPGGGGSAAGSMPPTSTRG